MAGRQTPEFDLDSLTQYSLFNLQGEDTASILTSFVTFVALVATAAFLSGVQLIGDPIECWCPAETTDAMCNYTKSFCWISKQYVIDYDEAIPMDATERDAAQKRQVEFYPWVPFILLVLALALKMPNFLWTAFQAEEGLNVTKAVQLAKNPTRNETDSSREVAFEMNFNLRRRRYTGLGACWTEVKRVATALLLFPLGGELGTYQTGLFLLTRLLAIALTVAAYPGLGMVLQTGFSSWGWELIHWVVMDGPEPEHNAFPRETLCDFRVRQMQNVHTYTVQCVLPINMWSEKAFLTLWFWLGLLLLANVYSYQYWFRKLLLPSNRRALISKHMSMLEPGLKKNNPKQFRIFALHHLNHDSHLVLRILEMAAGNRFANDVVAYLWKDYSQSLPTFEAVDAEEDGGHVVRRD